MSLAESNENLVSSKTINTKAFKHVFPTYYTKSRNFIHSHGLSLCAHRQKACWTPAIHII